MKSRLRMGINEVTRYLEAIATAQGLNLSKAKERREIKGSTSRPRPGKAIFLFCNDVQPPRIKDHLHVLAAVTGTIDRKKKLRVWITRKLLQSATFSFLRGSAFCEAGMECQLAQVPVASRLLLSVCSPFLEPTNLFSLPCPRNGFHACISSRNSLHTSTEC